MVTMSVLPGRGTTELSTRPSKIRLGPPRWISQRRALFFETTSRMASQCICIRGSLRLPSCNVMRQPLRLNGKRPELAPFEDLLLGAEPVLFVLARFTTAAFIELMGAFSYPVV